MSITIYLKRVTIGLPIDQYEFNKQFDCGICGYRHSIHIRLYHFRNYSVIDRQPTRNYFSLTKRFKMPIETLPDHTIHEIIVSMLCDRVKHDHMLFKLYYIQPR